MLGGSQTHNPIRSIRTAIGPVAWSALVMCNCGNPDTVFQLNVDKIVRESPERAETNAVIFNGVQLGGLTNALECCFKLATELTV